MRVSEVSGFRVAIVYGLELRRLGTPCRRQGSTNLKTELPLAKLLIAMKNAQTTLMFLVLCLASLSPMLAPQTELSPQIEEQETNGRDLIDLTIIDIALEGPINLAKR